MFPDDLLWQARPCQPADVCTPVRSLCWVHISLVGGAVPLNGGIRPRAGRENHSIMDVQTKLRDTEYVRPEAGDGRKSYSCPRHLLILQTAFFRFGEYLPPISPTWVMDNGLMFRLWGIYRTDGCSTTIVLLPARPVNICDWFYTEISGLKSVSRTYRLSLGDRGCYPVPWQPARATWQPTLVYYRHKDRSGSQGQGSSRSKTTLAFSSVTKGLDGWCPRGHHVWRVSALNAIRGNRGGSGRRLSVILQ